MAWETITYLVPCGRSFTVSERQHERERVEVGDIYSNLHLHQDSDSGFYFDVLVVKGYIR